MSIRQELLLRQIDFWNLKAEALIKSTKRSSDYEEDRDRQNRIQDMLDNSQQFIFELDILIREEEAK